MKSKIRSLHLLTPALALLALSACQGTAIDNEKKADKPAKESGADVDSIISEFPLQESLLTASRSYKVTSDEDTSLVWYVTLNTSVQWPEALGKHKIDNLRDSIVTLTFGIDAHKDIRKAIVKSVTDSEQYGLTGRIEEVDTIPQAAEISEFYATKALQLIECTQQTVTYSATSSEYMGGAHPNSGATPFSFVLGTDQAVTMDYLFEKGAMKELEPMIIEAIAASHSMSVEDVKRALINSPSVIVNNVYIINGNIAFHYNPYDILPYSYGPSEAFIMPYNVENLLTPAAKELLLN